MVIKDDASNQNTIVADYNALISQDKVDLLLGTFSSLLNLPASAVAERNRMLYVEPAGGAPDMFNRGFKYLFFAQQATADHQGDVWANYIAGAARGRAARRRPPTRRSTTRSRSRPPRASRRSSRRPASRPSTARPTRSTTRTSTRSPTRSSRTNADLVVNGATFEDGVGFIRALLKVDFAPKWLYQTTAPSLGDQYAEGIGAENTEGVFYAVSHSQEADTPGNPSSSPSTRRCSAARRCPRTRPTPTRRRGHAGRGRGEQDGRVDDQLKLADWLRQNEVDTILGPLSWNEDGSPKGEFLVGQWQSGKAEIVLPEEAATDGARSCRAGSPVPSEASSRRSDRSSSRRSSSAC